MRCVLVGPARARERALLELGTTVHNGGSSGARGTESASPRAFLLPHPQWSRFGSVAEAAWAARDSGWCDGGSVGPQAHIDADADLPRQCIDNFDGADGPGRWQWQRVGIQALLSAGKPVSARPKPVRCQASSSVSLAFAPPRSWLPFDGGSCASLSLGQFSVSRVTVGASC